MERRDHLRRHYVITPQKLQVPGRLCSIALTYKATRRTTLPSVTRIAVSLIRLCARSPLLTVSCQFVSQSLEGLISSRFLGKEPFESSPLADRGTEPGRRY